MLALDRRVGAQVKDMKGVGWVAAAEFCLAVEPPLTGLWFWWRMAKTGLPRGSSHNLCFPTPSLLPSSDSHRRFRGSLDPLGRVLGGTLPFPLCIWEEG